MGKIRIIKKNDEYNSEYSVGDVVEVSGTWYGGVHILGKTGVPVSLDKDEYVELENGSHGRPDDPSGQEDILEKKRLESFEKMLAAVEKEYQDIQGKMEDLKAKGRVKSATYQQLMGRKMMFQNMLSLYDLYDLREKGRED